MDKDSFIDKLLKKLDEDEYTYFYQDTEIIEELNVPYYFLLYCLEKARKEGLIDIDNSQPKNSNSAKLSPLGKYVLDNGGWIDYLIKQNILKKSAEQKALNDLILSNYQVKTRRYPLIISIVALIVSIIALIKSSINQKLSTPIQTETKAHTISTYIQTKKADSLRIPKNLKKP